MLIAGISLQLLAGIIFGLTHILPECRFKSANEKLKRFLLFTSRGRYKIRVPLYGALAVPAASIIAMFFVGDSNVWGDAQWYEAVGGVLIGSLMAATFYLLLLRKTAQLISRTRELRELSDDAYFRALLYSNLILILVLALFSWLIYLGYSWLFSVITGTVMQLIILTPVLFLIFLGVLSILAVYISLVFVLLAVAVKLLSKMAEAGKILWMIVLSLYVLGGAFLIASACQS